MSRGTGINPASARRAVARKLAVQALYRWQLNASPWQDVVKEFAVDEDMRKAERGYFNKLITEVCTGCEALDTALAAAERANAEAAPIKSAGSRMWGAANAERMMKGTPGAWRPAHASTSSPVK